MDLLPLEEQDVLDRDLYQDARRKHALYGNKTRGVIYCVTFSNGKRYIGQTSKIIHKRVNDHYNNAFYKYKTIFHKALRQEPYDCVWSILEVVDTTKYSLDDREKYWIAYYNSSDIEFGYNGTTGGEGFKITSECFKETLKRHNADLSWRTPEVGKKISESNKGNPYYQTEEFRETMSEVTKGDKNGMFGKSHSHETRAKMKGRKTKPEVVEQMRERAKKYTGECNPFYGKTHSDETKMKVSIALSKGVVIDSDGNSHSSVFAASKALNITEHAVKCNIRSGLFKKVEAIKPNLIDDQGKSYSSISEACKVTGNPRYWVKSQIRDGKWRYEELP